MSYSRSLTSAFSRSIDQAKHSLASALRLEVSAPTTANDARIPIYDLATQPDVQALATGCDADIGGLSSAKVGLDPQEAKGRFWGTLSSEIPRNAKIERSGYAAFRNKNRPTLFGTQTWDTTMHPYLSLRVKNRLAGPVSGSLLPLSSSPPPASPSLRSALSSSPPDGSSQSTQTRAVHALGLNLPAKAGPKFFVNVQTDGPVTSDLFQHRLILDESKGGAWQDVIIPLSDFVLTNTGQVSASQVSMMREKIRTVGISVVLDNPLLGNPADSKASNTPPGPLRSKEETSNSEQEQADWAVDGNLKGDDPRDPRETTSVGASRRGASYNFDLGIHSITAISEEGLSGKETSD